MVEVKFCGLTRAEDAARLPALGAAYGGVIFAGGPRLRSSAQAAEVLEPLAGTGVRRVGVFGAQSVESILEIADRVALDVLQLTVGEARDTRIALVTLRERFSGEIWPVAHTQPGASRSMVDPMDWYTAGATAVVLDAAVAGKLGGTGVPLDWDAIAPEVARLRGAGRVVLAGGLRPENVARAVLRTKPDVVDVSSGVERSPGVKDPEQMRAFASAVRACEV